MKTTYFIVALVNILFFSEKTFSQTLYNNTETIIIEPVGYTSQNGGTNGGFGGETVIVNTFSQLKYYAEQDNTPYIIKIDGNISGDGDVNDGSYEGSVHIASNKSIVGISNTAYLDGVGLTITNNSNIIIRNIKMSFISIKEAISDPSHDIEGIYSALGDEGRAQILVNDGDLISLTDGCSNIWIDHCELYSEPPQNQLNKDLYDGLIDIKENCTDITISWNYFHDHWKAFLWGGENYDRRITFHHNRVENINSRSPMYDAGHGHIFNNYYCKILDTGINCLDGSCVRIENNYFEDCKDPFGVFYNSQHPDGYYHLITNKVVNCSGDIPDTSNCTLEIPYEYYIHPVTVIKELLIQQTGPIISTETSIRRNTSENSTKIIEKIYPVPAKDYIYIEFIDANIENINCIITDIEGRNLITFKIYNTNPEISIKNLNPGIYVLKIYSGNQTAENFRIVKI